MKNQAIIHALKEIADANDGELRAIDVVNAAAVPESPLHSQFEWDDTKASHAFRLQQARQLIRVQVQYIGPVNDPQLSRVYVSLTPDRVKLHGGYRVLTDVMSVEGMRQQVLADALEDMRRFSAKYAHLTELAGVIDAMMQAMQKEVA